MHDRIAELRGLENELANCENGPRRGTRAEAADEVRAEISRVRGELEEQAAGLDEQAKQHTEQGQDALAGEATEEARRIRGALGAGQERAVESKPRRTAKPPSK
ncbi:hypothetical protein AB0I54_31695 [Streptomyces sp. NPDC050625]|uniref:hypothetical protein n=1 Tax=Streptomyces sp. NPDC050625 TaxID=3154629 RepID=UPI003448F447